MEATFGDALPESCFLPGDISWAVAMMVLPKLKAVMTNEEIIAASKGKQPELDRMRAITCRGCREIRCPLNFQFIPRGLKELTGLMDGGYADRIEKGDQLLSTILPPEFKAELEEIGLKCYSGQMPSRKNPQIWFTFERKGKSQRVGCEVGKRLLQTDAGEHPLCSLKQFEEKIEAAIWALL